MTPTAGWENFDNSFSLKLSKHPLLASLLLKLKIISQAQFEYIAFCGSKNIRFADCTRRIPLPDESVEVLYTSHMIGSMDDDGINLFLKEARRVLIPGGIIRMAEPDLDKKIELYNRNRDAHLFVTSVGLRPSRPRTAGDRISAALVGPRYYQTTFNGESLGKLLEISGFKDARVLASGETRIQNPGALDLREREAESFYVEALRI